MNGAERWGRVSEILSQALDLEGEERERFLLESARREPDLGRELRELSEQLDQGDDFLETPPVLDLEVEEQEDFGPYRVVGQLGEGGMGVVLLAERSDGQFDRRVAIKRIGRLAPGPEARRRFQEEGRILAGLDHPNIARLLDAGLDDAGVPFLVLEHVEGRTLDRWCREQAPGLPERLQLFLKVCAAVLHAHQQLVVHRDIKPANILVTADGEPKLLDFGIARLLDAETGQGTLTASPALTLDYASPEQVRGKSTTTAVDVYALGVVLYELLSDTQPYRCGEVSLSDAVELVCAVTPDPPSSKVPSTRRRALAGDLDAITMKAIEKAPADRYSSVLELARDVRASLDHRPVEARRAGTGYRARKFVRRHRVGVGAGAAIVALLAVGVAGVAWQARVAERERARAQRRFDEVRRLAHYVIFDLQDGIANLAGATSLRREMLQESLAYLDSLSEGAGEDVGLLRELADGYQRLGDVQGRTDSANLGDARGASASYGNGLSLLRHALSLAPADRETRKALGRHLMRVHTVGRMAAGENASEARRGADEALAEAGDVWRGLVDEEPRDADSLRGLASFHFGSSMRLNAGGDYAGAVAGLEAALGIYERLLEAAPGSQAMLRNAALCHKTLSAVHMMARDLDAARPHAQAAAMLDAARVEESPDDARARLDYSFDLSTLGDLALGEGRFDAARDRFEEALAIREELRERDPADVFAADRVAFMLVRVAESLVLAERPREALDPLTRALEVVEELGLDRPGAAVTHRRAHLLRGEIESALDGDPCPWLAVAGDDILDQDSPIFSWRLPALAARREAALSTLDACGLNR